MQRWFDFSIPHGIHSLSLQSVTASMQQAICKTEVRTLKTKQSYYRRDDETLNNHAPF